METYIEKEHELPVVEKVDVLVLGSGPAGFAAAVNSARNGLKTMLVESSGLIGGVAVSGLMSHWTGQTEGPFFEELISRAASADKDYQYASDKTLKRDHIIDTDKTELVMTKMLREAGVITLLYTLASAPIMDGKTVKGCIIENKSGRSAVLSKIVIDATGDGDIAAKAGVPFIIGREGDHKMQPVSLMFRIGGVDYEKAMFPGEFEDNIENIQDIGKAYFKDPNLGHVLLYPSALPGCVTVNMTNRLGVDSLDVRALTEASFDCRAQIPEIIEFLRKKVRGYESCYLIETAAQIGVRETRHFEGLYTITADDVENAVYFPDWIVTRAFFNFDVHGIDNAGLDPTGDQSNFRDKKKYMIPVGCFIPKEIDGLMFAGRNISGTHMAHSNYRAMPICANMGQGVAAVAKVAIENNVQPRNADIKLVQKHLLEQGVKV